MTRRHLTAVIILLVGLVVFGVSRRMTSTAAMSASGSCGSWKVVQSPGSNFAVLSGVAALSRMNVWAVGADGNGLLIEHCNGRQWSKVSAPNLRSAQLSGIAARSARDIWAVGAAAAGNTSNPLIEHDDGTRWSIVKNPGVNATVSAVTALSATNVWTVGDLIEHDDGMRWSIIKSPAGA